MLIQFVVEGGFGYFPGLNHPALIDTAKLSPQEAKQLESLVHSAGFFGLPETIGTVNRGAADYQTYIITVEDGMRSHRVSVVDLAENQGIQTLIERIREFV